MAGGGQDTPAADLRNRGAANQVEADTFRTVVELVEAGLCENRVMNLDEWKDAEEVRHWEAVKEGSG